MAFTHFVIFLTAIAIAVPFVFKYILPHKVDAHELLISVVASFVITAISMYAINSSMSSTELLHGQVTNKEQVRVSCSHSYSCNPVTTTDSNGNTTTTYSTCYEHSHDYRWLARTTVGDVEIPPVNRRGDVMPPRFSSIIIGEPATVENRYVDYVGAAKYSLHNTEETTITYAIPNYPSVTDVYRVNLVINMDSAISRDVENKLNELLRDELRTLGAKRQVNILVVATTNPRQFANQLQQAWNNGRKNDQVVVMGISDQETVEWIHAFGWSTNNAVNVGIRNDIHDIGSVKQPELIATAITSNIGMYFERVPMSNYEYLKSEAKIPTGVIIFVLLLQVIANAGISYAFIIRPNKFIR